jgi:hypothetical protein
MTWKVFKNAHESDAETKNSILTEHTTLLKILPSFEKFLAKIK